MKPIKGNGSTSHEGQPAKTFNTAASNSIANFDEPRVCVSPLTEHGTSTHHSTKAALDAAEVKQRQQCREKASLKQILSEHPEVRREVEMSYRRGFMRGAYVCSAQMEAGFSESQIKRWLISITYWREKLKYEKMPSKNATFPGWKCPPELFGQKPLGEKK